MIWAASELIDTLVFLFIWMVLFGKEEAIGGFTLKETVTYLIGVGLISNIVQIYFGMQISTDIRTGQLSNILVKPVSYPLTRIVRAVAEKPLDLLIRLGVYLGVIFFFREKFILNKHFLSVLFFLLSIAFAFVISAFFSFIVGCISFWLIMGRGGFHLARTINAIFSGRYGPLSFFPPLFQKIASLLPFASTRYFPMLIYLRKVSGGEIFKGFLVQLFWIAILYLISRYLWQKGLRRYEGVGI